MRKTILSKNQKCGVALAGLIMLHGHEVSDETYGEQLKKYGIDINEPVSINILNVMYRIADKTDRLIKSKLNKKKGSGK